MLYVEALERRIARQPLKQVRIASPFLLRTAVPPIQSVQGRNVVHLRRLGKRIAFGLEGDFWLVLHLMIAGRLHWRATGPIPSDGERILRTNISRVEPLNPGAVSGSAGTLAGEKLHGQLAGKGAGAPTLSGSAGPVRGLTNIQAVFDFPNGTLLLTEAGTKKRASLHLVRGEEALGALDPGGREALGCALDAFALTLSSRNHTLKRALTDPRLFSGIGNAYSDEILHRARLSPVALTQRVSHGEIERLHRATQETLTRWIELLRAETGDNFPEKVTAFRPEMAVHGKFGRACPVCGSKIQRIRYADNETNYCPACQTGGKLLADRSLSRLLKKDWPKTPEDLEELRSHPAAR